ncbi:MAG: cysteine desulfurase / selenocysteine lyase [Solirubrobacteraceae bacterium]|jgi:cysteine desulfurase/selenocysteine lyase|nr:cysteine desulfurase / selenocysteine lyase [Solirubrobacteraceae bacterium]
MATVAGTALVSPSEFPTLAREGLVYLDAAATSQTPLPVLAAMDDYYRHHRASVHRGVYPIAAEATDLFEGARQRIAAFAGGDAATTVFTRNATEALNLVARGTVGPGDKVVLTEMEHHSNLVSWQITGAEIAWLAVDEEGRVSLDDLDALLAAGDVKVVSVAHVSNVVGTINPIEEIVRRARAAGALSVIDGAQAVPQMPVDVAAIGADFYAWTGHKAYGPTGVGVLHGRREALEALPPLLGGGHMIAQVTKEGPRFAEVPTRFEAGTSAIAEAIGLGAAVDFLAAVGMDAVRAHEQELTAYALERLAGVEGLRIHGPSDPAGRGALVSFALPGIHPHDVAEILGSRGICVRAGHHCAQVLMKVLGEQATTRASFSVHTTREDVDALVDGLARVQEVFA